MGGSVPNIEEVGVVVASPYVEGLRREVAQLLGARGDRFPGAQPVSFARKHLAELRREDYFVCEKSDGIRCLLYFTRDVVGGETREVHYLIDRRNNYYQVPGLHFPRSADDLQSYHVDTLLDGELLWDTYPDGARRLKYLVFDCLVIDGQRLTERILDRRLGSLDTDIVAPYARLWERFRDDCEAFPFRLERKSMQRAYGIEMMFKMVIPGLRHTSDGLIFTCSKTPYVFGTDDHILKWKPAEENTIDFKLDLRFPLRRDGAGDEGGPAGAGGDGWRDDGDGPLPGAEYDDGELRAEWEYDYTRAPRAVLHVFGGEREPDREFSTLHLERAEWERLKLWAIARDTGLDGVIVECRQDSRGRWRLGRVREDKAEANHVSVAQRVLESIADGVAQDELLAAAPRIRDAWKQRDAERAGAAPSAGGGGPGGGQGRPKG